MTFAPTPAPKTITAQPNPTVTVTKTVISTPAPKPDDSLLYDQMQGWGTLAAVGAALLIALGTTWVEGRRRKRDQADGERQRAEDRADADRRLHEEREVADRRLQEQFQHQNERDRRDYLIQQLERVADLYGAYVKRVHMTSSSGARENFKHHPGVMALQALPEKYATLVRLQVLGVRTPQSDQRIDQAKRQAPVEGLLPASRVEDATYAELIENVNDLLGRSSP